MSNQKTDQKNAEKSSEPSDVDAPANSQPVFVIQKHDASNVHYDFRLQIEGALKSWVIPKGPSLNPSEKRLAIPTEDHSLEYADFEGVIPEDTYGAGAVMIWDKGTYRNLKAGDAHDTISMMDCYKNGQIKIELKGEKIEGAYALVKPKEGNINDNWLLIKMDDDKADDGSDPVINKTKSVKSGRTLSEIKAEKPETHKKQ